MTGRGHCGSPPGQALEVRKTSSATGHESKPWNLHGANPPDSEMARLQPQGAGQPGLPGGGSEGRVHAQLGFKLQLLSLLVADTDPNLVQLYDLVGDHHKDQGQAAQKPC